MIKSSLPNPKVLHKVFDCDFETGVLIWKERPVSMFTGGRHSVEHTRDLWNKRYAGTKALTTTSGPGYHRGHLFGVGIYAHRAIWAMHTGAWPIDQIDHINHIRTDNRIVNLREVTRRQNMQNQTLSARNTSGFLGGSWDQRDKRWIAQIVVNGENINLGGYVEKDAAISARKEANNKYGFHKNHGRKIT